MRIVLESETGDGAFGPNTTAVMMFYAFWCGACRATYNTACAGAGAGAVVVVVAVVGFDDDCLAL